MTFNNNAIFWVDTEKIKPNPYQPRRDFDQDKLQGLADSIKQYGVLQPLVVTRTEVYTEDGGMVSQYELIAGERRLRASRLAGVAQVPVVIRTEDESDSIKLELAIIENLQREDINPIDRALAFSKLSKEFGYKHGEIGKKVGRSREYVSNTIRLLGLPEEMLQAIVDGKMREGHARPLLMLGEKPDEQRVLFREIIIKGMNVRDAEQVSRRVAHDRARRFDISQRPDIKEFEQEVGEKFGTRVHVQKRQGAPGGKVVINFSSEEDLQKIMAELQDARDRAAQDAQASQEGVEHFEETYSPNESQGSSFMGHEKESSDIVENEEGSEPKEKSRRDDDIFSIDTFSI